MPTAQDSEIKQSQAVPAVQNTETRQNQAVPAAQDAEIRQSRAVNLLGGSISLQTAEYFDINKRTAGSDLPSVNLSVFARGRRISNSWGEFYTDNQKFTKISGVAAPHKSMHKNASGKIQIYADGTLVYESQSIERASEAFSFEASFNKPPKFIKISVVRTNGSQNNKVEIMLRDVLVY